MPIGSSFICFLAFWHVTHTEVYSLTPLKFNLGWLNTHVEVYITIFLSIRKAVSCDTAILESRYWDFSRLEN